MEENITEQHSRERQITERQVRVVHPFPPVFDGNSRVLILGTFPSVKSRENNFYYGHPRNRFWKVIACLTGEDTPQTTEEKKALLLRSHIAVWDVVQSCEITGSSDSSIRNAVPADLSEVLAASNIFKIFANGSKAGKLYRRYQQEQTGMDIVILPSTSPANASCSFEELCERWSVVADSLAI